MAFKSTNSDITTRILNHFDAQMEELKALVGKPSSCTTTCNINEFPIAGLIAELERIVNDNTIVNVNDLMLLLKAVTDQACTAHGMYITQGNTAPGALIKACAKFKDRLEKELSKLSEVNSERESLREDINNVIASWQRDLIDAIPTRSIYGTVPVAVLGNSLQSELDTYKYNPLESTLIVDNCLTEKNMRDDFGIKDCIRGKVDTSLTSTETLNSCTREVQKEITTFYFCITSETTNTCLPTAWTSLITECAAAPNSTIQNCIATNLQTPFDSLASCIDKNELIKNQNNASLITSDDLTTIKDSLGVIIEDYISANYITPASAIQVLQDAHFNTTLLNDLIQNATIYNILDEYKHETLEWALCENVML